MTDKIDTSPEALLAHLEKWASTLPMSTSRILESLAAEKADLVRERDEARGECGRLENEYIGQKERAEKAEADAAAMREALKEALEFVDRHSEDWYISGQELLQKIRDALSSTAGADLLEKMERMRALLERLKTARPLLLYGDAWIAEIEAALADQPGEKS